MFKASDWGASATVVFRLTTSTSMKCVFWATVLLGYNVQVILVWSGHLYTVHCTGADRVVLCWTFLFIFIDLYFFCLREYSESMYNLHSITFIKVYLHTSLQYGTKWIQYGLRYYYKFTILTVLFKFSNPLPLVLQIRFTDTNSADTAWKML